MALSGIAIPTIIFFPQISTKLKEAYVDVFAIQYTHFLVSKTGSSVIRSIPKMPNHKTQKQDIHEWYEIDKKREYEAGQEYSSNLNLYDFNDNKQYKCSIPMTQSLEKYSSFDADCLIYKISNHVYKTKDILSNLSLIKNKDEVKYNQLYVLSINKRALKEFKFTDEETMSVGVFENNSHNLQSTQNIMSLELNYRFHNQTLYGKTNKSLVSIQDTPKKTQKVNKKSKFCSAPNDDLDSQEDTNRSRCLLYRLDSFLKNSTEIITDKNFSNMHLINGESISKMTKNSLVLMHMPDAWFAMPKSNAIKKTHDYELINWSINEHGVLESKYQTLLKLQHIQPAIGFIDWHLNKHQIFIFDTPPAKHEII